MTGEKKSLESNGESKSDQSDIPIHNLCGKEVRFSGGLHYAVLFKHLISIICCSNMLSLMIDLFPKLEN